MDREFLMGLEVPEAVAEAILQEHNKVTAQWEEKYAQVTQQLEQAVFDGRLGAAIAQAGGRNHKAIAALLEVDTLRQADEDAIAQAVEQVKQACGYLFTAAAPYASGTGTVQPRQEKASSLADALREKFAG